MCVHSHVYAFHKVEDVTYIQKLEPVVVFERIHKFVVIYKRRSFKKTLIRGIIYSFVSQITLGWFFPSFFVIKSLERVEFHLKY